MRTYLIVLAKMRRPSTTPSARTPRSFSSRATSAASLATSVAVSTEMPTSASCRAIASLMPSPRKPISPPSARWARMMRDFCSGVTRAKIVVCGSASASSSSLSASSSVPVSVPSDSMPRSAQTFSATRPLSPVTILTETPSFASRSSDRAASSLEGSAKQRKPRSSRSCSSAGVSAVSSRAGRVATATTRLPLANSWSSTTSAPAGTRAQRSRIASGAPLATSRRPAGPSASAEPSCRSWSNVASATRRQASAPALPASGACQSARSSSLPPTTTPCSSAASFATSPSVSSSARAGRRHRAPARTRSAPRSGCRSCP